MSHVRKERTQEGRQAVLTGEKKKNIRRLYKKPKDEKKQKRA